MSVIRHEFSSHTYRIRPHSALSKHHTKRRALANLCVIEPEQNRWIQPIDVSILLWHFHSQSIVIPFSIYRNTNATAVVLLPSFETIIPASTNTHSHTHQLPISSTFPALSVTTTRRGLSPAPMSPRRSASLPPRALRGVVSTAFVHAVVPLSPRRWTAPRVTVGWRKTLAWCWGGGGDFG
jgi:hypothetical protein